MKVENLKRRISVAVIIGKEKVTGVLPGYTCIREHAKGRQLLKVTGPVRPAHIKSFSIVKEHGS